MKANDRVPAPQGKVADGVHCLDKPQRTNRVAMEAGRWPKLRRGPRNPGHIRLDPHAVKRKPKIRWVVFSVFFVIMAGPAYAQQNVLTYKYNNQRTGWNNNETVLTSGNVSGLQLQASVSLDDQSDAQPLVFNGTVYVVTENNSVYAIDPDSGQVIASTNFGSPVTTNAIGCNSGHVGITSTPVIDPGSGTLYVMVYAYNGSGNPTYQLHALDTGSLADRVTPATVAASGTLANGKPYSFDASVTRQRPALLLSVDGNIYAGFGSYCDNPPTVPGLTRGWLLGWQGVQGSSPLAPIGARLNNKNARSLNDFFLSGIWMSGSGVAEDGSANLYFATGNSDPSGKSYNVTSNLSESVIEESPDLTTTESFFTPFGGDGVRHLEENDLDMAAGGVLLTPDGYVAAAGKAGQMFLLRQGNLGGHALGNYVARRNIGICLCGESYYQGADGAGRIVSSGGDQNITVWFEPSFRKESASPTLNGSAGFFTSVSSNGSQNAIIWAVDRPANGNPAEVTLYAYDPATASVVFSAAAGTWPNASDGNPNIVPVVANGQVYVASYKQLTIWGLPAPTAPAAVVKLAHPAFQNPVQLASGEHDIFGTVTAIDGTTITVKKRDGTTISVNTTNATTGPPMIDEPVQVVGRGSKTELDAKWVARAKPQPKIWFPDR
jgi:outer membrane protein assembly factor BamB